MPNIIENEDDVYDDNDDDGNVSFESDELNDDDETSKVENTHRKKRELYGTEESFDVIILDALDPADNNDFTDVLWNDVTFIKSLFHELTDDGILVMQLGEFYSLDELPPEIFDANHVLVLWKCWISQNASIWWCSLWILGKSMEFFSCVQEL